MRLTTPVFAALTAALVLTGCGGVRLPGADPAPGIATMGFGLPDEIATTRVDLFRQRHPDVPLRITEGKLDPQQFLSSVAVKRPADLVYLDRDEVGTYASRGAIQPLDWCLAEHDIDVNVFRRSAVEQSSYGGKVYALPDFNNVTVVILNNKALREAGLDPATATPADIAARATKRDGGALTRVGFDPKLPEMLPLWAKARGVDLAGADGRPRLDAPEVVAGLTDAVEIARRQAPWSDLRAFRETFDLFGDENPYVADQLGGMIIETWYLNVLASTTPTVDVTVRPFIGADGQPLALGSGSAWAIPKGAAHPEEACAFAAHMTDAETWVAAARARKAGLAAKDRLYTGTYTGNKVADERIFREIYEPGRYPAIASGVQVALAVQDRSFAEVPGPVGAELTDAYEAACNRVLLGQQTPREALAQAQREVLDAWEERTA